MSSPNNSFTTSNVASTGNLTIDALLCGTKWGSLQGSGVSLSFSFPWTTYSSAYWQSNYSSINEQQATYHYGLNVSQMTAARNALQSWANVANITFTELSESSINVGDIRFAFSSALPLGSWGGSYNPNYYWADSGDVWINSSNTGENMNFSSGGYGYEALIHEIGHGLGLKHPGNYDSASNGTAGPYLPIQLDNRLYTLMSYNSLVNNLWYDTYTHHSVSSSNDETPMVYDIAAVQYLYGANTNYQAGNDIYSFDDRAPFSMTLWDAGGIDTISESNSSRACLIDLNPGSYSSIQTNRIYSQNGISDTYDGSYNLGIAYGAIIENATGGSGDDKLIGNSIDNILTGGAGNDILLGGDGNDTYYVDSAFDKVYETTTTTSTTDAGGTDIVISSVTYSLSSYVENLTLTGSLRINGIGNSLSNTIIGNSEANILTGGAGNDTLLGGDGVDTSSYQNTRSQYTLTNNGASYVVSGPDGADTLTNIERIQFIDTSVALDTDGVAGKAYRIYQAAFDRTPDHAGLGYWINSMDNGFSLEEVAYSFLDSQEFQTLYGANPTSEAFVTLLYNNVLNRAPDVAGIQYWLNEFQSGIIDKAGALASFSESAENQANVATLIANGIEYTFWA